jgi:cation diffusion facilitator family transporter
MRLRKKFEPPPEAAEARRKALRLEWISFFVLMFAAFLIYLTLGQSQAMKTAWISDLLALVPPIAFIIAARFEFRPPSERFPFGYFRAMSVAFLITAVLLLAVGAWLLFDAVMKLVQLERPVIGSVELFGRVIWSGYLMMGALATTVVMSFLLGRSKLKIAERLHSKVLEADADMNKADWLSEGAAVIGIGIVGLGMWWGDAVAAALISLSILYDGWHNLKQVLGDMMDESPSELGSLELEGLPSRVREMAEGLPWVKQAAVRLREQGHAISGEVFVVPREEDPMVRRLEETTAALEDLDWRIYSLTVTPVSAIPDDVTVRPSPR